MVVSPANRPGGRGDRRGYSRPARRDVPPAGVWCVPGVPCHHPGRYQEVCCWVGRFSWGGSRVDLTPISSTKSGSLCRGPSGSPRAFRVRVYRNAWDSTEANAGECLESFSYLSLFERASSRHFSLIRAVVFPLCVCSTLKDLDRCRGKCCSVAARPLAPKPPCPGSPAPPSPPRMYDTYVCLH